MKNKKYIEKGYYDALMNEYKKLHSECWHLKEQIKKLTEIINKKVGKISNLTKKQKQMWIVENCINEFGYIDLSGLFFNCNVNISHLTINGNLIQDHQKVNGGSLHQDSQKVENGSLWQNRQEVNNGHLYQNRQAVNGGILFQDSQKVNYGNLWQNNQEVNGNLEQGNQEVKGNLYQNNQKVEGQIRQDKIKKEGK